MRDIHVSAIADAVKKLCMEANWNLEPDMLRAFDKALGRERSEAGKQVLTILKDKKKILPCAAYLDGQYGVKGLYVGVPVKLGRQGVEQVIEIKLTPEEQAAFNKSAGAVRELVDKLKI